MGAKRKRFEDLCIQKAALNVIERIGVAPVGQVARVASRPCTADCSAYGQTKTPPKRGMVIACYILIPPRRFELTRCNSDDVTSGDPGANWLALALNEPGGLWHDRLGEMKALRAQGETLAAIGVRFGLSAERVRQILAEG